MSAGITSARTSGYTKPFPTFEPGLEIDSYHLTSITRFEYSPLVSKSGVKGFGSSVGATALDYWRVSRRVSLGGGVSFAQVSTSIWTKQTLRAAGGSLFATPVGRVFLNYERAVAFDQNHDQDVASDSRTRLRPRPAFS